MKMEITAKQPPVNQTAAQATTGGDQNVSRETFTKNTAQSPAIVTATQSPANQPPVNQATATQPAMNQPTATQSTARPTAMQSLVPQPSANQPSVNAGAPQEREVQQVHMKDAAHSEVYWQTYRQALAEAQDIRVARMEATKAEKQAKEMARKAERQRRRAQAAQRKYLLTMYQLDSAVTTQSRVADQLGVTRASTNQIIRDLIDMELVERCSRSSITLSQKGLLAAAGFHDRYSAIVEDLLRHLPPERSGPQKQGAMEAVLRLPHELVQELLQGLEQKNFSAGENLPAAGQSELQII